MEKKFRNGWYEQVKETRASGLARDVQRKLAVIVMSTFTWHNVHIKYHLKSHNN